MRSIPGLRSGVRTNSTPCLLSAPDPLVAPFLGVLTVSCCVWWVPKTTGGETEKMTDDEEIVAILSFCRNIKQPLCLPCNFNSENENTIYESVRTINVHSLNTPFLTYKQLNIVRTINVHFLEGNREQTKTVE